MRVKAIIGANYGDEGKGLATDYLTGPDSLVVRFNGGAQAGHTVCTPSGQRHVFSHIGAGSFRGADTFLSCYFIVNPRLYVQEYWALHGMGVNARVLVSPDAMVTTPFDVMLNHAVEAKRRHGSCGAGINETVTRSLSSTDVMVTVADLWNPVDYEKKLKYIAHDYAHARARALGVLLPPHDIAKLIGVSLEEAALTTERITMEETPLRRWLRLGRDVVFEGAQGLCLDEDSRDFPHVTRSRTGVTNVLRLLDAESLQHEPVHAFYMSRTYATRHGNGPLPDEVPSHPFSWTGPETNVENKFQGHFRYGVLDAASMGHRIRLDADRSSRVAAYLGVTCCDQAVLNLSGAISEASNIPLIFESHGPSRASVKLHVKESLISRMA